MISVNKALSIIQSSVNRVKSEKINVLDSMGRILSSSVKSLIDSPPFDMSAMDGYAVNLNKGKKIHKFKVIGEVFAGENKKNQIKLNEAVRVFTGSKLPRDTIKVIIQEKVTKIDDNFIYLKGVNNKESYIRKKGQDYKKGSILLKKNHQVSARDVGLLISSGIKKISVYKKPNVAVIATGNELVKNGKILKNGQIYASSLYMISSLLKLVNTNCNLLQIVEDDEKSLKNCFKNLQDVNLIITTGGVSVGKKDLVKKCLEDLGMHTKFWRVNVKPGKPLLYGLFKNIPTFGLPGNAVSSYVCFVLFVIEAIKKMNCTSDQIIKKKSAILTENISNESNRETYYRGVFFIKTNKKYVRVLSNQDSSLMKNLSTANCLIKIDRKENICKNNIVEIIELYNGF